MSLPKVNTIDGTCVPLNRNNIDTDQIIPARFLKGTSKVGLGKNLFQDWRYDDAGQPIAEFVLSDATYGGPILVAAHNFGCGSSREHAPWALKDYGFQAIIAISFADIFCNNALKNGLLTVTLPEEAVLKLLQDIVQNPALSVSINLEKEQVEIPDQSTQSFNIDPYRKKCLQEGLDDIGYALSQADAISAYEKSLA